MTWQDGIWIERLAGCFIQLNDSFIKQRQLSS